MQQLAEFTYGDIRRKLSIGEDSGSIVLRDDLTGPGVLAVYGETERVHKLTFSLPALEQLKEVLSPCHHANSLASYLASPQNDLLALMDVCDANRVPVAFCGLGSMSGIQFRASS